MMKNYILLVMLVVWGTLYSCKREPHECDHQELIDWIEAGNFKIGDSKSLKNDLDIISLLQSFTALDSSNKDIDLIKRLVADKIGLDSAKYYHGFYKNRRSKIISTQPPGRDTFRIDLDTSDAILLTLDTIWPAMRANFSSQLSDPTKWKDIGFLVYLANYGRRGHYDNGVVVDTFQSSIILQLAERDNIDLGTWNIKEGEIYNFGGLKPPKVIINNEEI